MYKNVNTKTIDLECQKHLSNRHFLLLKNTMGTFNVRLRSYAVPSNATSEIL